MVVAAVDAAIAQAKTSATKPTLILCKTNIGQGSPNRAGTAKAVTQQGGDAIRARYQTLFAAYPENHAALVNRVVVGDVVIDHEDITRSPRERINAAAIYTVKNGLIARVDFVRAP